MEIDLIKVIYVISYYSHDILFENRKDRNLSSRTLAYSRGVSMTDRAVPDAMPAKITRSSTP